MALRDRASKSLLLGIDVGTYSSKAVVTTVDGEVLSTASVAHGLSMPRPGHVEHDADAVWWSDLCTLCRHVVHGQRFTGHDIAAVAVSAIGPCLLPLDGRMRPLRPAILYGVDVRAAREIAELEAAIGAREVLDFSRMAFTSQAIGPKIAWLRRHEPAVWAATEHLTTASAYLTYRLTGSHRIDHHTASHFMPLYDPRRGAWDPRHEDLVAPTSMLPQPGWCDELAGVVHDDAARATGLAPGTPVAVGAVDALSEALSVGVVAPGDLMLMYGSSNFFVLVQSEPTPDARVWTVAGAYPGQTNLAAGMSTTGSLTRWVADELAREFLDTASAYDALFSGAAEVPPGAGGLLVLPYFSGERTPINDPRARGVVAGLTLSHTRAHLYRAVLEGVGFGIRHNLETFAAIGARVDRVVAVGGGAQTDVWLQIVSDISGVPQAVPQVKLGASYGDAFLAGCAAGLVRRSDLPRWARVERHVQPRADHAAVYDPMYAMYRALYDGTRDVVHRLQGLSS